MVSSARLAGCSYPAPGIEPGLAWCSPSMQSDGIGTVAGVSAAPAGPLAPSWQLFREHEVARGALSRVCPEIKKCMLRAPVRAL